MRGWHCATRICPTYCDILCSNVKGEANPATATAKGSKTQIMAHLKGAFDYCDGVYSGFTDAHLNDPADFFGVKEGVLVKSVEEDSAAEKGGIKAGDVVVKVGDAKVSTTEDITRALHSLKDGKTALNVVVVRNKKETTLAVTIESSGSGLFRTVAASTRV